MEEISTTLGLQPSHTHRAGDLGKFGAHFPDDMWALDSSLGREADMETHLEWLVNQLKPHVEYLKALKDEYKIDIFCAYTSIGDGGLSLPPATLSVICELGVNLEISIIALRPKSWPD